MASQLTGPNRSRLCVGVTHGMRGYFAVLYDDAGPIQSGIGSYEHPNDAWVEARDWASSEDLPLSEGAPNLVQPMRDPDHKPPSPARCYTGIGSRETPADVLRLMTRIAQRLATLGYTLRSGAADGADAAFEAGSIAREIYLPWEGFNQRSASEPGVFVTSRLPCAQAAEALAAEYHPGWAKLGQGARRLHARNTTQVLGASLAAPSSFVVCWARNPRLVGEKIADVAGGTGLAVRLAHARNVPIFHLGIDEHRARIERWLDRSGAAGASEP